MKVTWSLPSPLGTADIYWSEEWYNTRKAEYPQITVTPLTSPLLQRFKDSAEMKQLHRNLYLINCWVKVRAGGDGSAELTQAGSLCHEAAKVFLEGIENGYGGSLSPWGAVLPLDKGIPRHDLEVQPRIYRYEVTIVATEHFTK